ncbi:MAG: HAMP domain-containing histidine kinase, partial [Treponema sp.]|nr:HAMP domain-containing histidine kinase [Treponema sp.]
MLRERIRSMKISSRAWSLAAALLAWLLLSALAVFIIRGMRHGAELVRDNENERIFNMLITGLRQHDNFGAVIEGNAILNERIAGFAIYGGDLRPLYTWGTAPPVFDERLLLESGGRFLSGGAAAGRFGRFTIPNRRGNSVRFILRADNSPPEPDPRILVPPGTPVPPVPPEARAEERGARNQRRTFSQQGFPFMALMRRGGYYYIDITHPAYWRTMTLTAALLPLCSIALLAMALYIRRLYLRNREYRERIEAQKNLVVLGTAAGTLAHEIKTPLSSIRIQTGILEKMLSLNGCGSGVQNDGRAELAIINEEVDRLSSLSRRVNDYLRDGRGNPAALNLSKLIGETGGRLCGRDIISPGSDRDAWVCADTERLRSVFENLIRNALESGGPPEAVEAAISRGGGTITALIRDRGNGVAEADLSRVFDPFFTK